MVFGVTSVLFWLLLSIKTIRPRFGILRWCVAPMILAIASGAAMYHLDKRDPHLAIVVDNSIELRNGDGEEFPTVVKLTATAGKAISIIDQRADWREVRLPGGQTGWLPKTSVVKVAL
jgi:SH3-like domain-containing protein